MQELTVGSKLQNGKYVILGVLGQGGFGITYEGIQGGLNRRVAIKEFFMKDYCVRDEATGVVTVPSKSSVELVNTYQEKFLKEAQLIASMNEEGVPHIVHIHEVFEENETAYYVMEFVPGGSLKKFVKEHGRLSEGLAVTYIRQVGEALKQLHKRNTLHLDLKPDNVLINSKGEAVLIDFGVSKHYDEDGSQTTSTPLGLSKGFAPSEQYEQGGISQFTPTTDVYSLAATLYYLLTAQTPPVPSSIMDNGFPEQPSYVSTVIWTAISKAMRPSRKERTQTVQSFLDALPEDEGTPTVVAAPMPAKTTDSVPPSPSTPVAPEPPIPPKTPDSPEPHEEEDNEKSFLSRHKGLLAFLVLLIVAGGVTFLLLRNSEGGGSFFDSDDDEAVAVGDRAPMALKGRVGEESPFTMNLRFSGKAIEGKEHYDYQPATSIIEIKGTLGEGQVMVLNEYYNGNVVGRYEGLLNDSVYSGKFDNLRGKTQPFTARVMSPEELTKAIEEEKHLVTKEVSYEHHDKYANVSVMIEYPTGGNQVLVEAMRDGINVLLANRIDCSPFNGSLNDGQALVDYYGAIRHGALKGIAENNGSSDAMTESIEVMKDRETNLFVTYIIDTESRYRNMLTTYSEGVTFRKADGKRLNVLKDSESDDFKKLLVKAVHDQLAVLSESLNEDFADNPMPEKPPFLVDNGVEFTYQPYEIGPRVLGHVSVFIPYAKLKPYMTAEARYMMQNE